MRTHKLTERTEILAFLETDRLYGAYAIGDLEPGLFGDCTWAGAWAEGQQRALILHYRGLTPAALFLMGDSEGLRAILDTELRPDKVYLTCRPEQVSLASAFYAWPEPVPMWRMVLVQPAFEPVAGNCVRLAGSDAGRLAALFELGGGLAFSPTQIEHGVFYGIYERGELVSVGGTHLVGPTHGLAAVGNVFTHPEHRGRGHGTAATSAVVEALLRQGIRDVILNVGQANVGAVRIYERLGFERYCPFFEGPASAR
jgi:ribosomal protein S18 acetylase RimI-like enzyme